MSRYKTLLSAIALLAGTSGALRSQSLSVTTSGVAPRGTIERGDCLTVSLAPNAAYECSDLRIVHPLPTTITMNKERTPTLLYNSRHSSVGMLIGANFTYSGSTPDSIVATATVVGVPAVTRKYTWNASCNGAACRVVVPVFGADTATTGLREFTIQVQAFVGGSPTSGSATDSVVLINRARSPFGAGWWLAGLEQLISVSGTKKLVIGGDGSARLYTYTGSGGTYTVQPAYDRPDTLTDVGSGRWRRHLGDGAFTAFNSSGQHDSTRNALGHVTTFSYSGAKMTAITLPSGSTGRAYNLYYGTTGAGADIIDSVLAPAAASARKTTFAASGSFISSITDPGMGAVNFAYASNRMTTRVNRTSDTTFVAYDASGGIDSAYISLSRTDAGVRVANRFKPAETRSAQVANDAVVTLAKAYTHHDGPRTDLTDTTVFFVGQRGAPDTLVNALGHVTRITRNSSFPALADSVVAPNGFKRAATYDARGLMTSSTEVNPRGDSQNATTTYAWHSVWNHPVAVTSPEGVVDSTGYDGSYPIPVWNQPGTSSSRRVTFKYTADNLPDTLQPASHGSSDVYQFYYDAGLRNLITTATPLGKMTGFDRDAVGRDTLRSTKLHVTRYVTDRSVYDARDLLIRRVSASDSSGTDSTVVHNGYNAEGLLDTVKTKSHLDPASIGWITRVFTHDGANRQRTEALTGTGGFTITTSYDKAGNVTSGGRENATFTYDALNRPITRSADEATSFFYNSMGALDSAKNPYARIKRTYQNNGALKTDTIAFSAPDTSDQDFSAKYGLVHSYDKDGRRTSVAHPGGTTSFSYESDFGMLSTVTDPLSQTYVHYYTVDGLLDSLINLPGATTNRIRDVRRYTLDGEVRKRVVAGGSGAGTLRDDTLTYNLLGKVLNRNGSQVAWYNALGQLRASGVGGNSEEFTQDAMGNMSGQALASVWTNNTFQSGTGRITMGITPQGGNADTTWYYYGGRGETGNKMIHRFAFNDGVTDYYDVRTEDLLYSSDSKLKKVTVTLDTTPVPSLPWRAHTFAENYWYDPLGRRIASHVWRNTNCSSKNPTSGCENTLTRFIWDGDQIIHEARFVFSTNDTIPADWTPSIPNSYVSYVMGHWLDRPLALIKDGSSTVVPVEDFRGQFDKGTCPTSACAANDPQFPGATGSAYGSITPSGNYWHGSLILGMTEASGHVYRRNRHLDPRTGRFTQEDPIGLAGGVNLYGFANSDPINFGDPFGLFADSLPPKRRSLNFGNCAVAAGAFSLALTGDALLTASGVGLARRGVTLAGETIGMFATSMLRGSTSVASTRAAAASTAFASSYVGVHKTIAVGLPTAPLPDAMIGNVSWSSLVPLTGHFERWDRVGKVCQQVSSSLLP